MFIFKDLDLPGAERVLQLEAILEGIVFLHPNYLKIIIRVGVKIKSLAKSDMHEIERLREVWYLTRISVNCAC